MCWQLITAQDTEKAQPAQHARFKNRRQHAVSENQLLGIQLDRGSREGAAFRSTPCSHCTVRCVADGHMSFVTAVKRGFMTCRVPAAQFVCRREAGSRGGGGLHGAG
jgi:hypothetical protein